MKLNLKFAGKGMDVLANIASEFPNQLPKEIRTVNNKVAKNTKTKIGQEIRKHIAINAKGAKEPIHVKKADQPGQNSQVTVQREARPPLKRFGAKQKKKGVSYRISKKGSRQTIKNAFGPNIPKLNGHVFVRSGKKRLPIRMLYGVSVAAVFQKQGLIGPTKKQIQERMEYEIGRRIRALNVRAIRRNGRKNGLSTEQINKQLSSL
jgi:hypothetical protein